MGLIMKTGGMKGETFEMAKDIELIIKGRIKSAVPELNVASDVAPELNKKVIELLEQASKRAKLNGRRTLQARDL